MITKTKQRKINEETSSVPRLCHTKTLAHFYKISCIIKWWNIPLFIAPSDPEKRFLHRKSKQFYSVSRIIVDNDPRYGNLRLINVLSPSFVVKFSSSFVFSFRIPNDQSNRWFVSIHLSQSIVSIYSNKKSSFLWETYLSMLYRFVKRLYKELRIRDIKLKDTEEEKQESFGKLSSTIDHGTVSPYFL